MKTKKGEKKKGLKTERKKEKKKEHRVTKITAGSNILVEFCFESSL